LKDNKQKDVSLIETEKISSSSLINEKGGFPNYYNTYHKINPGAENETKEEKKHTSFYLVLFICYQ
jgi:hypothetical protein